MLGLTACAMASAVGVSAVVGCDVDDARLSLARQFGATHTVALPGGAGLVDLVQSLTDGRGADLAFELSGSPVAAGLSLDVLRTGGSAVWVGAVLPTDTVSVSPEQVIRRCLTLTGIHNYAPPDLATAVAFLQAYQRRFPFAGLVPRTFALDEIDEAFGFAAAEKPVRVGVGPGG
jgi:alcohol dehydrogenase